MRQWLPQWLPREKAGWRPLPLVPGAPGTKERGRVSLSGAGAQGMRAGDNVEASTQAQPAFRPAWNPQGEGEGRGKHTGRGQIALQFRNLVSFCSRLAPP